MPFQDEEIFGLQDQGNSLLSTKMKNIQHLKALPNCLTSLNSRRHLLELPSSCTSQQSFNSNNTSPIKPSLFAPKLYEKRLSSPLRQRKKLGRKSKLRKSSQRIQPPPRLFEVTRINKLMQMKQINILLLKEFSGTGLLVLPTGKKFQGEWVDGKLFGKAKIIYPNGDVYFGQTYDYCRHGQGQLVTQDTKYVGQFSGEDMHGSGILYNKEGKILLEGEWRRNSHIPY